MESLTVIVYDLYTLDNAGHGFDDVIAQVVLFTSRSILPMDVVSSAERLCFHVWLISPGVSGLRSGCHLDGVFWSK